jgi:ornithine carbamoyltransferase
MLFQKPSLRTRVSFETGMTELGGHAIYYPLGDSPLGKKETISDTAKVLSRMLSVITARINSRKDMQELADNSTVPVINILDDFAHPCQMLADLQV